METLGTRLKATRLAKGMSQTELSRRSGVNQSDISKLENGAVAGSTKVVQLALAVGCDPLWLATGEGEPSYYSHTQFDHLQPRPAEIEVRGASAFLEGDAKIDSSDQSVQGVIVGSEAPHGYAIKVKGDRHAPALKDGQFVVVEPGEIPLGDLGLFTLNDGRVLLRELLRETTEAFYVDLPAWGARQTLPKVEVQFTEHVVAVVSPSRWRRHEA